VIVRDLWYKGETNPALFFQLGRQCNVVSTNDIAKIEVKLNRRHSQMTHFSEWGLAEIAMADIPALGEDAAELWLPVVRRTSGEQIGVLLVKVGKKLI
jgi:hypothetical protein